MATRHAAGLAALLVTGALGACTAPEVPAPDAVAIEAEPVGGEPIFWNVRPDTGRVPARVEPQRDARVLTDLPAEQTRVRSLGCTPAAPDAAPAWCRVETDAGLGWVSTRHLERPTP